MSRHDGGLIGRIEIQRDARAIARSAQLGADAQRDREQRAEAARRAEAAEATQRALAARQRAIEARRAPTPQPAAAALDTGAQPPRFEQKFHGVSVDRGADGTKRYRFTI